VFRAVFIPLGTEYSKKRDKRWEKTLLPLMDSLGGVLIVLVGMFWVFTVMGVDVTVFLAGMGVAGLVLAFALQDTLSNYFSGLHLMLDRPFEVGDTIEIDEEFMEVLNVGMRSTRLYNIFAHEVVNVPNNIIANQMLTVITKPDLEYRVAVDVGVAYGSPVEKVKEILFEAVRSNDEVILDDEEKRPRVNFTDFGDSALQFRVRFFVRDVLEQWRVKTAVREHIDRRFREEGITIPFPQRTISYLEQKEEKEKAEVLKMDPPKPAPA
jgi:small-conductance mechanosensitive channel